MEFHDLKRNASIQHRATAPYKMMIYGILAVALVASVLSLLSLFVGQ